MGTVYSRYLAGGYTAADYRAAMLSLATELYGGAPTYYNPDVDYPYGYQYLEWPDFDGIKVYWGRSSTNTAITLGIASSAYFSTSSTPQRLYRNAKQSGNWTNDPSDKTQPAYLIGVRGEDYMIFALQNSGTSVGTRYVARFTNPTPIWGAYNRVYLSTDFVNVAFPAGLNPWGALNEVGNASTAGQDSANAESSKPGQVNPQTGKREIVVKTRVVNDYATIGIRPEEIGLAPDNLGHNLMAIFDAGEQGLYLKLPGSTLSGLCVKVDAAPFSGMTTYPAYVFDATNPEGITDPEECVEVWPAYGQAFPNHRALNLTGGGETP